ncbi:hypothetical protein M885DRAFT_504175 [Pelagophyceae sp. CCMP2097]|nr:hypothetical protein M885DRAFT_504175 [Pelagophyceae sp. CCMP2097]|mmetsp:Transcript_18466/g.62280  ORF Transcript_18466/g.62280 Transcript_18466/m.62280 type:complete len:196 (-) Transcript_18466:2-589(-)
MSPVSCHGRGRAVLLALCGLFVSEAFRCGGAAVRRAPAMQGRKSRLGDLDPATAAKKDRILSPVGGITAPAKGKMKGWALQVGEKSVRLAAINTGGKLYVMESSCTCCAFELEKGTLVEDRVACPLCGQSFKLSNGALGPIFKRNKVADWLAGVTREAPTVKKATPARCVKAEVAEDGEVLLDLAQLAKLATAQK